MRVRKQKMEIDRYITLFLGMFQEKKAVFLIQNIFPTTERYIENKYVNSNIDVEIPTRIRDNVIITSIRVVELAERGINIPFYDIIEMKKILLNK